MTDDDNNNNTNNNVNDKSQKVDLIDLTHEDDRLNVKQECCDSINMQQHQQDSVTSTQNVSTYAQLDTIRFQLDNFKRENKLLLKEKLDKKTEIRRLNLKVVNLQSDNAKLKQEKDQLEKELEELRNQPTTSTCGLSTRDYKPDLDLIYNLLTSRKLDTHADDLVDKIKEELELLNSKQKNLISELEGTLGNELPRSDDDLATSERVVSRVNSLIAEFNLARESAKLHLEQIRDLEEKELKSADKIVTLKQKIDDLKKDLRSFKERRENISTAFTREKSQRLRLSSIVEHYKKKISSLFETIKTKDISLRSRTDEYYALKKERDNLMEELIDKRADLNNAQCDINKLRRKIDELEDWNDKEETLYKENTELKKKLDEMETDLTRARETRVQVELEYAKFKQESFQKHAKLNETVEKLMKEIDYLKNDNGAKLKELSQLNDSNEVKLNDTIEQLKKEIEFFKSDAQLRANEMNQASNVRLIEVEEANQKLSGQLEELKKELINTKETSESEMSKLREELAKKRFIVESLSDKRNDCLMALKREQDLTEKLKTKLQKFDSLIKQTCNKYIDLNEPNNFIVKQEPFDDSIENRMTSKRSIQTSELQAQGDTYKRTCI